MTPRLIGSIAVMGALALSGCASKVPETHQYSGFLGSYDDMQQTTSASGAPILRWVDPTFDGKRYSGLIYKSIVYYPEARPSSQIGRQVLDGLLSYTDAQLKASAQKRLPLVDKPGPGVLVFRGAITAVDTSNSDLKPRELIPVALVIAGARTATGQRPKDTNLYFEAELIDSVTNKPVVRVVRKGQGKVVTNAQQQVTVNDLKTVIDNFAADGVMLDLMK